MKRAENAQLRLAVRSAIRQSEMIEAQLGVEEEGRRCFADLEGIWKGKVDFSLEEIRDAEIQTQNQLE